MVVRGMPPVAQAEQLVVVREADPEPREQQELQTQDPVAVAVAMVVPMVVLEDLVSLF